MKGFIKALTSTVYKPENDSNLFNNDSAWYYDGDLYYLGSITHGMWLTLNADKFGIPFKPLDFDDEWSADWIFDMQLAFSIGFVRLQKYNNIATITVNNFSNKEKDRLFEMFEHYPSYFSDCKYIEIVTLKWETELSDLDDCETYQPGNYICGESLNDIMERLG